MLYFFYYLHTRMVDVTDLLSWIPDRFMCVIANYNLLQNDTKISRP